MSGLLDVLHWPGDERRRHPRYLVREDYTVRIRFQGEVSRCRVGNISVGGLYVDCHIRPEVGDDIEVELYTEDRAEVDWFDAVARRVVGTWDPRSLRRVVGLGLELMPRDDGQRELVSRLLASVTVNPPEESDFVSFVKQRSQLAGGFAIYQERIAFEHQDVLMDESDAPDTAVAKEGKAAGRGPTDPRRGLSKI